MAVLADPPGADRPAAIARRLEAAYRAKGPDYRPRTALVGDDGGARYVNRLIEEPSPYLLQHAHNPVDWHPWGDEALAEAARRGVPVFLSIGYATCHWCHVMEEESFDDEEVAAVLNAHFLPVKLDREQRPDLDHVYITATQIQQGHAGWPNSVFLMPDGRPFHTGTYFPKPHFLQLLRTVHAAWSGPQRGQIEQVAANLSAAIRRLGPSGGTGAGTPDAAHAGALARQLADMANPTHGGFSTSQQFPQEGFLLFLLDHWRRTGDDGALALASRTLDAIAAGGIHDHVGGGFHRYTVDPDWRTPHFEKMLYNQALLSRALLEGWAATGNAAWLRAARRTFAYVARDMTDTEGAFHAAEDADSRDAAGRLEEGAFYAWTPDQVRAALGADADAAIAALRLHDAPTLDAGAVAHLEPGAPVEAAALDPLLERLRKARDARERPLRDEKIIAGWNGLMIRALAEGAALLDEPPLAGQAARAAEALWRRLWTGTRLHRLWAGGRALEPGMLEDYAWVALGCLALFDATGEARWRERAETLARAMMDRFGDPSGRLRMAETDAPTGPVFDGADGAVPAGESSALELLARLARRSPDPAWPSAAGALVRAIGGQLCQTPLMRPDAMVAARALAEGETGPVRTLLDGTVRLALDRRQPALRVAVAEGWHLMAADPGPAHLTGATVEGAAADWPPADTLEPGFADAVLRVHEGRFAVRLDLAAEALAVTLQCCSDSLCLEPATARFRLR